MPKQAKTAQSIEHRGAIETASVVSDKPERAKSPDEDEQCLMRRKTLAKYGFNPKTDGRFAITNELVDQIREELGI